ncbi:BPSL0067 family protein, partial [Salmonella enterica subsp. enterica serovar Kentucky]|nr:hypothetical protein [Salmonella enterica]EHR3359967.1 BPSL0067 family protein [Salmonella enterica subsp. enterica serovar Kentucky]HAE1467877.1 BPSL0067 family protein [Salmonella enterica subsp. enterica serovar Infantis]
HQCVELIQHYIRVGQTSTWQQGAAVFGNKNIEVGTVIATFVNGRYPNHNSGNHAAFFLGQDAGGIWVMDQWKDDIAKPRVSKRYIRKLHNGSVRSDGTYIRMSNNAEAYFIVE